MPAVGAGRDHKTEAPRERGEEWRRDSRDRGRGRRDDDEGESLVQSVNYRRGLASEVYSESIRATSASRSYIPNARWRPRSPRRRRRSGSARRREIPSAIAFSSGVTSTAAGGSPTTSGTPPTRVAHTAQPLARPSMSAPG